MLIHWFDSIKKSSISQVAGACTVFEGHIIRINLDKKVKMEIYIYAYIIYSINFIFMNIYTIDFYSFPGAQR